MRILTIQERIELGQSKNQATEILKIYISKNPIATEDDYALFYKKWAKRFLRWNKELEADLQEGDGVEKHNTTSQKSTEQPLSPQYPEHPKGKWGERR